MEFESDFIIALLTFVFGGMSRKKIERIETYEFPQIEHGRTKIVCG